MKKEDKREELKKTQNEIFKQWEKRWTEGGDSGYDKSHFVNWFRAFWEYTNFKIEKNREKNFESKQKYLNFIMQRSLRSMGLLLFFHIFILLIKNGMRIKIPSIVFINIWFENTGGVEVPTISEMIFFDILFIVLVLFIPMNVIKTKIGIRKYQETWARHSTNKSRVLREMIKYIYGINPYNKWDKQLSFMSNILQIVEESGKKFEDNMENKETPLAIGEELKGMLKKII